MIMMRFVWPAFWFVLGGLLVWHWIALRRRLREGLSAPLPELDDEAIRRIESDGLISTLEDEPLDLEKIADEEDDFWSSESWDPAEDL